jgi:hypothetical protein
VVISRFNSFLTGIFSDFHSPISVLFNKNSNTFPFPGSLSLILSNNCQRNTENNINLIVILILMEPAVGLVVLWLNGLALAERVVFLRLGGLGG